jgi:hypothetical protein
MDQVVVSYHWLGVAKIGGFMRGFLVEGGGRKDEIARGACYNLPHVKSHAGLDGWIAAHVDGGFFYAQED